jgi:hypothetical protein
MQRRFRRDQRTGEVAVLLRQQSDHTGSPGAPRWGFPFMLRGCWCVPQDAVRGSPPELVAGGGTSNDVMEFTMCQDEAGPDPYSSVPIRPRQKEQPQR